MMFLSIIQLYVQSDFRCNLGLTIFLIFSRWKSSSLSSDCEVATTKRSSQTIFAAKPHIWKGKHAESWSNICFRFVSSLFWPFSNKLSFNSTSEALFRDNFYVTFAVRLLLIRECSLSLCKHVQFEIQHQFIETFPFIVLPLSQI